MNILITGGTGFIGRNIVNKLLADGKKPIILTRDRRKVDKLFQEKIKVLEVDICNTASLERLGLRLQGIDALIHLAASLDYFGDKKKLFQVNVKGTVNLINLADRAGIRKFIYISSIEAMGTLKKEEVPADETFFCRPVSSYGESKLEAERQIRRLTEKKDVESVILRLGNVYGPGTVSFIVPIANAILNNDKLLKFLPIYKDRYIHPVYIDDAVSGILKVVEQNSSGEIYILADEEYVSIGRLFELIAEILNVDSLQAKKRSIKDILYLSIRKKIYQLCKRADLLAYFVAGERKRIHRAYSIEKAKRDLGYYPEVNLKEGIAKSLEWAKEKGLFRYKYESLTYKFAR